MHKNKKQLKAEILDKISKMEQNTFLFPESWSDVIDMVDEDWRYKTYNAGYKGSKRYHNFVIYKEGERGLDINFRGDKIEIVQDLEEKTIHLKDVLYYISAIYEELHSFKNHNEGRRKIRKQIYEKIDLIKREKEALLKLRKQLIDSKNIKS